MLARLTFNLKCSQEKSFMLGLLKKTDLDQEPHRLDVFCLQANDAHRQAKKSLSQSASTSLFHISYTVELTFVSRRRSGPLSFALTNKRTWNQNA